MNDIYVHDSAVNYSGITGILCGADVVGVTYNRKLCDGYTDPNLGFADDSSVLLPRDLRFEYNTLEYNRTGAMGCAGRWVGLRYNTFIENYLWPQGQGAPDPNQAGGGTVEFDQCTDQLQISSNTFAGPGSQHNYTDALELYARNVTVDNNTMSGYFYEAIAAYGLLNSQILHNTITYSDNNSKASGGISVATYGPGACNKDPLDIPRDSDTVSISGNSSSGQASGIQLTDHSAKGTGALHNLTICTDSNSSLCSRYGPNTLNGITAPVELDAFVWANAYDGYTGPRTTPGVQQNPGTTDITPRSLAVDAISGSHDALCSTTGGAREKFTFSGSDDTSGSGNILPNWNHNPVDYGGPNYGDTNYSGAGQVYSIEAILSHAGADDGGSGGPSNTTQDCHLVYYPDSKTVWLDIPDANQNTTWAAGSSPVGGGGHDLTNPNGCIIHAGSSPTPSGYQIGQYTQSVTFDIEFLGATSRKHVYVFVVNKHNEHSYGFGDVNPPIWKYWGWWQMP